ncbi:glycosyltransferase family 2 protein, partial [Alistipes indistinctus]
VGGFDPLFHHYGEDNNYCQRVLHQSLTIRVVPQALVCHDRKSAARPLRNAWVGRYLLITYADPRFSPWQATRRTLRRQAATLARVPYYLLRGDGKSASEILKAYRTLLRRRNEILKSKHTNASRGAHWL